MNSCPSHDVEQGCFASGVFGAFFLVVLFSALLGSTPSLPFPLHPGPVAPTSARYYSATGQSVRSAMSRCFWSPRLQAAPCPRLWASRQLAARAEAAPLSVVGAPNFFSCWPGPSAAIPCSVSPRFYFALLYPYLDHQPTRLCFLPRVASGLCLALRSFVLVIC